MAKLNQARRDQAWRLWQSGMTFEQIGAMLDPSVSKQAVHQLIYKIWNQRFGEYGNKVLDVSERKAYK